MAFGKFFALFCISLAVFAPTEVASDGDNFPELIGKSITAITAALDKVIVLLENWIDGFDNNPDSIETSLVDIVRQILVAVEDDLKNKVDTLGDSLDSDGLGLYNCFEASRDDSNDRLLAFFTEFFSCANPSLVKVVEKVDPILEVLRTADNNCAAVADDFAKCGETEWSCMITSTLSIINEIVGIADNLEQPIADIKEAASSVADALKDCASQGSDEWYIEFFEGIGGFGKCYCGSRK